MIHHNTDSFGTIVTAVEKLAQPGSPKVTKAKRAPTRKKVVVKNSVVEKIKRIPATQIVYDLIKNSIQGINTDELMKNTGYNQRKIHNITFRLKQQGRIESVGRGCTKKYDSV